MPDMLAIISKAVFEKEAAGLIPGQVFATDRYRSASRFLEPLKAGGRLFLVTVRPPKEALWLVGVLEGLSLEDGAWRGTPNRVPITVINHLVKRLRFESGKGITAAKGALGMSLQTPRALSAGDVHLLLEAASGVKPEPRLVNLTAHDGSAPVPCLCKRCLPASGERAEAGGMRFSRARVETAEHELHYWLPEELAPRAEEVARAVRGTLTSRLARD
ncbi:hypothetical protein P2318_09315 [Myxococcaceae bacterium GXIMD 01537]